MSGAGTAPVLTLHPPPSLERPGTGELTAQGRRRQVIARRYATVGVMTGALLPVPLVAAGPYLGAGAFVGLVVSWALLLPGCGLALLLAAALGRTRDDLRALVLVAVSLAVAVALLGPAGRLGMEAFAASHAAELDGIAAERAAALAHVAPGAVWESNVGFGRTAGGRTLRRLGLDFPTPAHGGLHFNTTAPFAPDLLYADAAFDVEPGPRGCARAWVRPVGGRWFLFACGDRVANGD
jgi:hypothetical protein